MACNALSLSSAQLYDQSSYCVKSTLAGAAVDNDDCLPKSDDRNDNDDNIETVTRGLLTGRRRHGGSISGYDWLSVRYPD